MLSLARVVLTKFFFNGLNRFHSTVCLFGISHSWDQYMSNTNTILYREVISIRKPILHFKASITSVNQFGAGFFREIDTQGHHNWTMKNPEILSDMRATEETMMVFSNSVYPNETPCDTAMNMIYRSKWCHVCTLYKIWQIHIKDIWNHIYAFSNCCYWGNLW